MHRYTVLMAVIQTVFSSLVCGYPPSTTAIVFVLSLIFYWLMEDIIV